MELFKIFGTIAVNNQEANDSLDETTGRAHNSQKKIVDSFKKIGTAVVTYLAVDKIVNFGKACISAAADANAAESQFVQVFGDVEDSARESLAGIASDAGITENRMKGSFTKIAAFAKTSGMNTADALALSERAMIAVADSAAFYDRTLEETTESLQSFLKGNFENDAALGLSCTETTRNAAANALYGKSFIELSESQKQLTLLQMVEDANKLSGALGQSARESETWTNQTGNLKQAWTDFKAIVGQYFLEPAIHGLTKVTEIVQLCSEKVPVLVSWIQNMYDKVSVYFPEILAIVSQCFDGIKQFWEMHLKPCFDAIGAFIKNVLAPAFQTVFNGIIAPAVDTAFNFIVGVWNDVLMPVLTGIIDFITGVFSANWKLAWEGLKSIVTGVFNGIITGIETMINSAINAVNRLIEGLNDLVDVAGDVLGFDFSIPLLPRLKLPRLAQGGILEKGQVGLLEGSGAEAVVPLDQNRAWISAVAEDMNEALGGSRHTQELKEAFQAFVDELPDILRDAFASMRFDVNNREFARLVKAVN